LCFFYCDVTKNDWLFIIHQSKKIDWKREKESNYWNLKKRKIFAEEQQKTNTLNQIPKKNWKRLFFLILLFNKRINLIHKNLKFKSKSISLTESNNLKWPKKILNFEFLSVIGLVNKGYLGWNSIKEVFNIIYETIYFNWYFSKVPKNQLEEVFKCTIQI